MFIDTVTLTVIAGNGGNGAVAWRREKYIPKGGPAGGDGGNGGSIILQANENLYSLEHLRNYTSIKAKNGASGGGSNQKGKSGEDRFIDIPIGTLVKEKKTGKVIHDFLVDKETFVLCKGGKGGKGNTHFKSSTNQAPIEFTFGTSGEEQEIELELKLIADIGLVGMPNAGKSTLMSIITHVPVKVAPYPFTTLKPNLGIVRSYDQRLFLADIPGIIPYAHKDKGLGLTFLRHIERTSMLLFVIDISGMEGRDPVEDFLLLKNELEQYNPSLLEKPYFVVLNKIDQDFSKNVETFIEKCGVEKEKIFQTCGLTSEGIATLQQALFSFQ